MALTRYYEQSRFTNNKGVQEGNYTYNSNNLEGTIVCEGPSPTNPYHVRSFLSNLIERGITHHIAAGDPFDGRSAEKGFLDITNPVECSELLQGDPVITAVRIENAYNVSTANAYVVFIKSEHLAQPYQVNYLTFPNWKDFEAEQFNHDTIKTIHEFIQSLNDIKSSQLGVNCTAGLGRSGVFALALCLYNNIVTSHYIKHEENVCQIMVTSFFKDRLEDMRKQRPGLVQTDEQFYLAIALAAQLRRLDLKYLLLDTKDLVEQVKKTLAPKTELKEVMPEPVQATSAQVTAVHMPSGSIQQPVIQPASVQPDVAVERIPNVNRASRDDVFTHEKL